MYQYAVKTLVVSFKGETNSKLVAALMIFAGYVVMLVTVLVLVIPVVWAVNAMLDAGRLDVWHAFVVASVLAMLIR